jgi:uncharacterized protein YbgA (DUF1722 family)/uncharacterized protein YbbK (DUF523 family)
MSEAIKPRVVVSRCLELEPVRYNAQVIPYDFVRQLEPFVTFVPVCPELEIGLGVPRDPVRIVVLGGEARLLQPTTGRDLTAEMLSFADSFLSGLGDVDGFILKSRSPSCGIKDTKVYEGSEESASARTGAGVFAGKVLERYPSLAIEDEGRLRNYKIREHFLTRLFGIRRFRRLRQTGQMRDLVRFHAEHKLLLMAYSQRELRTLGQIVANPARRPFADLLRDYEAHFHRALARAPRSTAVINVLEHAAGYFSKQLNRSEKSYFRSALERYRKGRVPASAPTAIVRAWIVRFEQSYLLPQTFFDPFPEQLVSVSDSGKGREL